MKPKFILKESALKSPINEVSEGYNDLFVANRDILFSADGHKVTVPKGTVLSAIGGGYFGDESGKIKLGNINAIDGNFKAQYPGIRNDTDNFVKISDPSWELGFKLAEKLEDWNRRTREQISSIGHGGDVNAIKIAIAKKMGILRKIESILH